MEKHKEPKQEEVFRERARKILPPEKRMEALSALNAQVWATMSEEAKIEFKRRQRQKRLYIFDKEKNDYVLKNKDQY